jgi:hypothetical protein
MNVQPHKDTAPLRRRPHLQRSPGLWSLGTAIDWAEHQAQAAQEAGLDGVAAAWERLRWDLSRFIRVDEP